MHVIAGKAVCFKEALTAGVQGISASSILKNAQALGKGSDSPWRENLVSGGTDNHLMLVDLRRCKR